MGYLASPVDTSGVAVRTRNSSALSAGRPFSNLATPPWIDPSKGRALSLATSSERSLVLPWETGYAKGRLFACLIRTPILPTK